MRTIRIRSAGPLISKLRKRELARKRSNVSSMISAALGSAREFSQNECNGSCEVENSEPIGEGPRIFVLIGSTDMFPTTRTSGSSLYDE